MYRKMMKIMYKNASYQKPFAKVHDYKNAILRKMHKNTVDFYEASFYLN